MHVFRWMSSIPNKLLHYFQSVFLICLLILNKHVTTRIIMEFELGKLLETSIQFRLLPDFLLFVFFVLFYDYFFFVIRRLLVILLKYKRAHLTLFVLFYDFFFCFYIFFRRLFVILLKYIRAHLTLFVILMFGLLIN
jgi:hypothetical protein